MNRNLKSRGNRGNRMARRGEAVSLGDALTEWLRLSGHGARMEDARAETAWKEVMGEAVARKTRYIRVKDGVMVIELDSAPMKEEFLMARTRIREIMNEHLGKEAIREVIIR